MGLFSGTKKAVGHVVNFKITDWFNTDSHKANINYIINYSKNLFYTEQPSYKETFEQAMERLQLNEQDILSRKKEFLKLFLISLTISILLFGYTMFITIQYKNLYSFILGIGVTILSLSKTFRYHFWLIQVTKKKLGLTFKDWLN